MVDKMTKKIHKKIIYTWLTFKNDIVQFASSLDRINNCRDHEFFHDIWPWKTMPCNSWATWLCELAHQSRQALRYALEAKHTCEYEETLVGWDHSDMCGLWCGNQLVKCLLIEKKMTIGAPQHVSVDAACITDIWKVNVFEVGAMNSNEGFSPSKRCFHFFPCWLWQEFSLPAGSAVGSTLLLLTRLVVVCPRCKAIHRWFVQLCVRYILWPAFSTQFLVATLRMVLLYKPFCETNHLACRVSIQLQKAKERDFSCDCILFEGQNNNWCQIE